jgi:epoxyqueuosine reductase
MGPVWTEHMRSWLAERAAALGFDLAAVAPVPERDSPDGLLERERFEQWIAAGRAGEMEYLKRRNHDGELMRSHLHAAFPWARSVVVCAFNYNAALPGEQAPAPRSIDPAPQSAGWIGRYAWSGRARVGVPAEDVAERDASPSHLPTDYHDELLWRLRALEQELVAHMPCETRSYVDTGPMVERVAAQRAGLGWVAKNTCIINQQIGSYTLLASIITSLECAPEFTVEPAADRCGSCTRCIEACPTGALVAPRQMDGSLCIAYLTIEKKGSIAEELRAPMGRQVFGCDICQDVCPWNRRAPVTQRDGMEPRAELVNPDLAWLAEMDSAAFRLNFRGSPLERPGRTRLHRNVAIAMGNSGDPRFRVQLEAWAAGEDPVLAESAQWALRQLAVPKPFATTEPEGLDSHVAASIEQ